MLMNQQELSTLIASQLIQNQSSLAEMWGKGRPARHCFIDNLLPVDIARSIHDSLPDPGNLMLRKSIKERKRVGIKLEEYVPEMTAILFAFQDPAVVEIVGRITGLEHLSADASLYGSGISEMITGDFLMPHLDNSHDGDGNLYRVLNLLYYVTPDWPEDAGGNLELWDKDMKNKVTIHSKFNRLVLMETHTDSIHGVSQVSLEGGMRACISNYYFSPEPANHKDHVHKTTFFARTEDPATTKLQLGVESGAKRLLARFMKNDTRKTKHRR